jgi:hypothetical protein
MRSILAILLVFLATTAQAGTWVITDSFGMPSVTGGTEHGWAEQLDATVISSHRVTSWWVVRQLRYYPNRYDFTGDTVIIAFGLDEIESSWDPFEWTAQLTWTIQQVIAMGAERVFVQQIVVPTGQRTWEHDLLDWGLRAATSAVPRRGNPRAAPLHIWHGMMIAGLDLFPPGAERMDQAGHDAYAERVRRHLRLP